MNNWTGMNLLEIVEGLAKREGMISDEEELSGRFDNMMDECHEYPEHFTPTDIRTFFNDWSDEVCKEGEIHEEQYNQYGYVGRFESE